MRGVRAEKIVASRPNTPGVTRTKLKWSKIHDHQSGYDYYYNTEDGTTTWDVPADYEESSECIPSEVLLETEEKKKEKVYSEWFEVYDPASGHNYYQNLIDENVSQWEIPDGFDPIVARKRLKLLMSSGSLNDLPHGLALLVATKRIQSAYRAKQARQRMRGVRAEHFVHSRPSSRANGDTITSVWVEMVDSHSGYPYWYNSETNETTWDDPKPQEEYERLTKERVNNLITAINDADDDMDVIMSIVEMIPNENAFDICRKLAKEKLDEYEYNTAHINNLTDNQTRHSRASIRPDHIGKIHSH